MERSFPGSRSSRDRSILRKRLKKLDSQIHWLKEQYKIEQFLRWGNTQLLKKKLLELDEKRRITRLRLKGYDV
jgi:hypothetical protein